MTDLVGKFGCGVFMLFLDFFVRVHSIFQGPILQNYPDTPI
jgi:hypothetical protein